MTIDHPNSRPPATSTPTLLVFTRGHREPKRLLPRGLGRQEAVLHRLCLEAAVAAGREAGCPIVVCSPDGVEHPAGTRALVQQGRGFSDRLAQAVEQVGDEPILVVPADVPGLTAEHLRLADEALAADPDTVVVGPSPDGGLYLLATARPLPAELLRRVRWCRRDTRAHLLALLATAGRKVVLLEFLADLDRPADLERWLSRSSTMSVRWRRLLASLLTALRALRRPSVLAPSLPFLPSRRPFAGRAPPALLAV